MKAITKIITGSLLAIASTISANAQYYQLANQATDMLSTILQGGASYRGFVDVSYIGGIGSKKANFLEFSTTQGNKFSNLFFMGIGAGVDVMFSQVNANPYQPTGSEYTQTAVMIPLFTDFRFNFGEPQKSGFFIDIKIGAGFYVSDKYILVGDGYINSRESFYLKPTLGCRIPISSNNSKYAINIGASYQLLTNSYWYNPTQKNSITMNGLGLTAAFEW